MASKRNKKKKAAKARQRNSAPKTPKALRQLDPNRWQLDPTPTMKVPGIIYTDEAGIASLSNDGTLDQIEAVAGLPGILQAAYAMPDFHCGYGFPIGGVAAFDEKEGIVSPGGVGYDINCGVRLATTFLTEKEIQPRLESLVVELFKAVPTGVGGTSDLKLSPTDLKAVLTQGSRWAVEQGLGSPSDLERTEDQGCMAGADAHSLSPRALERGRPQLATLGSGNHFLEIGVVDQIFCPHTAKAFGLAKGQITLMLHCGSRGLGHQVCQDHLGAMAAAGSKGPLAHAPLKSETGRHYLTAMAAAANYAWANRQILLHQARQVFMKTLDISPRELGMNLLYDVSHNMARMENHSVQGKTQKVCVHRKGATRAFGPGHPSLPPAFRTTGQPILIPGDMGTASFVLAGTRTAMDQTFGSTSHGAGRTLSRSAAKKAAHGRDIRAELSSQGIQIRWTGKTTLAEEMPEAYKDVNQVTRILQDAGISKQVARIRPMGVIKG